MHNSSQQENHLQVEKSMNRLRKIAELSLALSGEPVEIFRKIAQMIGDLLEVKIVCLSEIKEETLQFLSVYNNGDVLMDAGQCILANTPIIFPIIVRRDIAIFKVSGVDKVFFPGFRGPQNCDFISFKPQYR